MVEFEELQVMAREKEALLQEEIRKGELKWAFL